MTNLSLPEAEDAPNTAAPGTIECKFWGLGGDGTVGANKNSIKIIGDHTDKYVQAYFQYDSKKTGGVTVSHLRFGDSPIRSPYYVTKADFVACHNPSYIVKGFKMVRDVKPGGTFLVNCQWSDEEFAEHMPAVAKRYIANNNVNVYLIDAIDLAAKVGMGKRTNTVLQSAFFALAKVLPAEDALQYMKDAATKSYMKKGQAIVDANHKAIDAGATAFRKFEVPADWATAEDAAPVELSEETKFAIAQQVKNLLEPIDRMDGDSLPVSAFVDCADGQFELGASAYEKRGVAVVVPHWDETKCIQCNQCAYVCPHATIRPFAMTEDEAAAAPEATRTLDAMGPKAKGMSSPWPCPRSTAWAAPTASRSAPRAPSRWFPPSRRWTSSPFGTTWSRTSPRRRSSSRPTSRAASLSSLTWSSLVPAPLRRDRLCTSGDPGRRRPHVHLQRHRLLLHLGQPRCHRSLLQGQGRSRPGVEQLPVRGQCRARSGHGRWL